MKGISKPQADRCPCFEGTCCLRLQARSPCISPADYAVLTSPKAVIVTLPW